MKIGRLVVITIAVLLLLMFFSDRGAVGFWHSRDKLAALRVENQRITDENIRLRKEVLLLRNNMEYIETVARRELGMMREGEVVYRFRDR